MSETTYTRTTVDYKGIVHALMTVTNEAYARAKEHGYSTGWKDGRLIGEFRTIGFTTGRQTGKNGWMADFYGKYREETIVIFKDDLHQRAFTSLLSSRNRLVAVVAHVLLRDLRPCLVGTETFPAESAEGIKYIIVDEATFMFSGRLNRESFNDWVYETFGPEVMVILVG